MDTGVSPVSTGQNNGESLLNTRGSLRGGWIPAPFLFSSLYAFQQGFSDTTANPNDYRILRKPSAAIPSDTNITKNIRHIAVSDILVTPRGFEPR